MIDLADVQRHRGLYGRLILVCGDSIAAGYALGTFEPSTTDPLYRLRSPAATLSWVLDQNGITDTVVATGPGLISGSPNGDPNLAPIVRPDQLAAIFADGTLRPGDAVVIEDAGPHPDPDWYAASLRSLVEIVDAHPYVSLLLTTTPDYPPAPLDSQWDAPYPDGRTLNGVVRAVAAESHTAHVALLDWDTTDANYRATTYGTWGVPTFQSDGIHPNVWGQLGLCRLILFAAGLRHRVRDVDEIAAVTREHWRRLGYGSPYVSAALAEEWPRWFLLQV